MGFQGIKNQGTDPLQLFLAIRQLRQQEQASQQQAALDRVKAAQDAQKFALDMDIKRADLQAKQAANAGVIANARANADAELTPADVSIPGGGAESQAFGSIVSGLDPAGVRRGVNAQAAFADALRPGVQSGRSVESLLGDAAATERASQRDRERATSAEIDKEKRAERRKIAAETRAEARKVAAENRASANGGRWDRDALVQYGKGYEETTLEPVRSIGMARSAIDRARKALKDGKGLGLIGVELGNRYVQNVDPGVSVREGEFMILTYYGVSSMEELKAKWDGMTDQEKKMPPELIEVMANSLEDVIGTRSESVVTSYMDELDRADARGWDAKQRNEAIPVTRPLQKEIISTFSGSIPKPSKEQFDAAQDAASEFFNKPRKRITERDALSYWYLSNGRGL
jgi:hypothetical protein